MSNGEVRVGFGRISSIFRKIFKFMKIRKSPIIYNLPLKKIDEKIDPFYFGLPQLNITTIRVLLLKMLFITKKHQREKNSRKFMAF